MYWNWRLSGAALAGCFLSAILLVKPIGVSTQFVIADGLIASIFNSELVTENTQARSGYESSNAYLNKSGGKYAKSVAHPINYGFVFVLSMILGGWIASRNQRAQERTPRFHQTRFPEAAHYMRSVLAFMGGVLVLFGARLAGGCTSGHMMSGMMQTALSGYLFAAAAFMVAIPTAIGLYHKGGNE